MRTRSDIEVKNKGLNVLFKERGEVDAIRFLSQIRYERKDYLNIQDKLFKNMSVDEIVEKAKSCSESKNLDKEVSIP